MRTTAQDRRGIKRKDCNGKHTTLSQRASRVEEMSNSVTVDTFCTVKAPKRSWQLSWALKAGRIY